MAAAQLDTVRLASYCSLPQQSIDTLLDSPTADLVRTLLENVSTKAREYVEITSEKLRLGVELENAVRGGESKNRVLKGSVDKSLKEAADLRQKLQAEESARESLGNELESLKESTSTATSELSTRKARIESLESSNRGTLALLESKSTAYDQLGDELNAQHQKTIELRQQVTTLEQSVQAANTASTSAKFHEQGLQQEIESLKRNNDWLDKELKTKSAEYTKYRKEKSLRIAELQRQYDEAQSVIDAASRTETTLRRRLEELNQKADESFSRVQQMQEEAARKDQEFRQELDSASRLTELTRNSLNTERQRQQDLFAQLETAKEDASEQLGQLGAELETEHGEREAAEAKIAELDLHIEHLQADFTALRTQVSTSGGFHQGINGFAPGTPARGASTPQSTSGTPRPKGGLSVTQMYSDLNDTRSELTREKGRNEQLATTLDDLVQELAARQPEVEELQADHGRLEMEVTELSSLMEAIGKERDQAIKETKRWQGQIQAKEGEGDVLRQQLRDLSAQVKVFLMEINLRDQGHDELSVQGRAQLERVAHGQHDGDILEGVTATDRLISEQLVTFRNIAELQEQNKNLLKITREIGERMEHEEALRTQTENTRNWDDLQQKYERCRDEVKSLMTQSQSYIRERDMFRRLVSHRGQLPTGSDTNSMFEDSVNGDTPKTPTPGRVKNSVEDSPSAKDLADYAKLYKDMQQHFDAYRNEAATDRSTLKEQVDGLSRQNGELRSEVVRSNSQVALAHERYEMLQANYGMLKNENSELQKRSQNLSDGASKQEMRVQQVAEELVEVKGLVDSMRNENANLKAEKEFWNTIQKRITEDNENLLNERGRLNALNTSLQNLMNEREHSDIEARRRLQSQVDNLEKDLQLTKTKLSEETEENKRNAQRREYDHEQSQKRIDDLVSSLGSIREQLIAANTTKDHLSSRVDELTIQLRSAEERVNVLQPTPTSRPHNANGDNEQEASADNEESGLSPEQELAVQLSELKRDFDLNKAKIEDLNGQVEQYKGISQNTEEELHSLNETQDLYRQEMDNLIEEKNARIRVLEQRMEEITEELASSNTELADLRNEQTENGRRLDDQRKTFEVELSQLKEQDERHAADAKFSQEDLKAQAEIAQQAQQNYESELIKHGDAAKALQSVRSDMNELKLEIAEVKTEAESARTNLSQSEESWVDSRNRYERELAELKTGRENLTAQNNRLHQQLESVTSQVSSLNKRAPGGSEAPSEDAQGSSLDNLQEVIKYLRREKEIIDVQLELSTQEGKRLKQQLDYTQSQLDDTRLRLNQQRRLEADNERSSLDHNKLMETINELNTFRESSVTLRAESRQAQASLGARSKEVEELNAQIEPLKSEILELKNEHETQVGEMKLLKENSDRWQQRAQNVLQKYDRVDPAELEALKEQVKTLAAERDELLASKQSLQEQVDSAASHMTQAQDQSNEKLETMRARLTDQFKSRSKTLSDRIREKENALQAAANEKQDLEQRLAGLSDLQNELNMARSERNTAIERAGTQTAAADSETHDGSEEGQVEEGGLSKPTQSDLQAVQDKLTTAEARANQEASESANLRSQLEAYESRMAELEKQIVSQCELQESVHASKAEVDQLQSAQQQQTNVPANSETDQQIQQLREDLARVQQEAEDLRTTASVNTSLASAPDDGAKSVADQVADHVEAVRVELEARHNERLKQADETLATRTNQMKANLSKKLTDGKNQIRQSLTAENEQAIQALKTAHEQELVVLRSRHNDELDELRKLVEDANKKSDNVQTTDGPSDVKTEDQTSHGPYQPTEAEAKVLVQSNEVVRSILRQNVVKQVAKAKEDVSVQLKEEHEKSLAEIQSKSESTKAHAVLMEGKKNALQINMAANKFKIAQFRVDLVQKSAQDTPQKTVSEVWTSVKDAKPPPATAPQPPSQAQQGQGAHQRPKTPVVNPFGQSTPASQNAALQKSQQVIAQGLPSNISTFGRPTPAAPAPAPRISSPTAQQNPQQRSMQFNAQTQPPPSVSTFGRPTPAAPAAQAQSPNAQKTPQQQPPQTQAASNAPSGNQRSPQQVVPLQHLQQKPPQPTGSANNHPNAGTGPGALRGLQQSGLPMPRGGSIRGNPNPARGRSSGIGRGGPPINTNQGQGQQGGGSPVSGGLNAGAKQFVPGNKRPRDDQEGQQGDGKRIRGGGAGS